jgi:hypothetical protein
MNADISSRFSNTSLLKHKLEKNTPKSSIPIFNQLYGSNSQNKLRTINFTRQRIQFRSTNNSPRLLGSESTFDHNNVGPLASIAVPSPLHSRIVDVNVKPPKIKLCKNKDKSKSGVTVIMPSIKMRPRQQLQQQQSSLNLNAQE